MTAAEPIIGTMDTERLRSCGLSESMLAVENIIEQEDRIAFASVVVIVSERMSISLVRIEFKIVGEFDEELGDGEDAETSFSPVEFWCFIISLLNKLVRIRKAMLSFARISIVVRRKEDTPPPITIKTNEFMVDEG